MFYRSGEVRVSFMALRKVYLEHWTNSKKRRHLMGNSSSKPAKNIKITYKYVSTLTAHKMANTKTNQRSISKSKN
jgi:hypothetical protein